MAVELTVVGMTCDGCEEIVEFSVGNADGIERVTADRRENRVVVEGSVDRDELVEKVRMAGYEVVE